VPQSGPASTTTELGHAAAALAEADAQSRHEAHENSWPVVRKTAATHAPASVVAVHVSYWGPPFGHVPRYVHCTEPGRPESAFVFTLPASKLDVLHVPVSAHGTLASMPGIPPASKELEPQSPDCV